MDSEFQFVPFVTNFTEVNFTPRDFTTWESLAGVYLCFIFAADGKLQLH